MPLLPALLKLSLLALSCALILSGFALTGAAFLRSSTLIAGAAGLFLLLAAGAPLLIGRQIREALRDKEADASDEFSVFEDVTAGQIEEPAVPFAFAEDAFPDVTSGSDEEMRLSR